jgi:hypothetical protein
MADRTNLIDDLRNRFKDGATPSELIRRILSVLGNTISYTELCDVLQEAFHLPVVRISLSSTAPRHDHRGAILNKTLLMEIVQRRSDWDAPCSHTLPVKPSWMDCLSQETLEDIVNKVRAAPFPGLSDTSWSMLRPKEQEALYAHLVSSIVISQRVEVLSKLAERLQEKLSERNDTNTQ